MDSTDPPQPPTGPRTGPAGRPRDQRIDDAILRATMEVLEDIGYTKLTVPIVAARAGTTPPAVHRRWASKVELVYEAAFPSAADQEVPWGDDLESSIRAIVEGAVAIIGEPATRAAISGLIAELDARPGLAASLLGRLQGPMYEQLQRHLDEAAADGRAEAGIDARYLVDMIGGAVLMSLANERVLDATWVDQTVRVIVGGLAR